KIMNNGNLDQFRYPPEMAKKLLNHIPPFPLDVSTAAYYLKVTNIPYEDYLKHLSEHKVDFDILQKNILKEATQYNKTRYDIITLSIKSLINTHRDFDSILLFVSLLGSQSIPSDLLNLYKDKLAVDNFIYEAKKYSLVTEAPSSHLTRGIAIHRSTQEISLAYLTEKLNLSKNPQLLMKISEVLEKYMTYTIHNEDLSKMPFLINHCNIFLSHRYLLTDTIKSIIGIKLGCIYFYLGNYIKAKDLIEKGLTKLHASSAYHCGIIAQALVHLGMVYRELGNYEKARELLEQSLIVYTKYFSKDDIQIAPALEYLGITYRSLGNYQKAKELLEQSLVIYKKHLSNNQISCARALVYLGNVYRDLGDYEKAKELLEQSLIIYKTHFSNDHVGIGRALVYLGNTHKELGNAEESKHCLEQSLMIFKKYYSDNHPKVAWVLVNLGDAYKELGDYKKAKSCFKKSYKIYENQFGKHHIKAAWSLVNLAGVYKKLGNYKKAKGLLEQNLTTYEKSFGKNHIETARLLRDLGEIFLLERELITAENLITKSLKIFQENKHPESHTCLESLSDLYLKKALQSAKKGNTQQSQKFKQQSFTYLKQALKIVLKTSPKNSSHITRIQSKLKALEPL
ncbi:MAG: tetratricopeptide repeat protein, partial [Alphaproteobacteria bacterium]|nr:tetratricopeptide repeat protein [Alphaproteobacteria bacterium]